MPTTVTALSFDAADAALAATFWAAVLGREVGEGASVEFATVSPSDVTQTGPFLMFHKVPEGKTVKNRIHLDLHTDDLATETTRLLGLGAVQLNEVEQNGHHWITFADPEGNEFDVLG